MSFIANCSSRARPALVMSPKVELVKVEPKGTTVLIADKGRAAEAPEVERLLNAGCTLELAWEILQPLAPAAVVTKT